MAVEVVEPARRRVRCTCGALLSYGVKDVRHGRPPTGQLATHVACHTGGWPSIDCPECHRAVLVSGCW